MDIVLFVKFGNRIEIKGKLKMENRNKQIASLGARLASIFTDYIMMCFAIFLVTLLVYINTIIKAFNVDHEELDFSYYKIISIFILSIVIYINKDIFGGQSIGKRKNNIVVIDKKNNQVASSFKCMLRNLTILIGPVDLIFMFLSPERRRLGDIIVGTKVVYSKNYEKRSINWRKSIITIILSLGIVTILCSPFLIHEFSFLSNKVNYVKSSLNKTKGEEVNIRFRHELSDLIKEADFLVYDSIENSKKKYVTGILYLYNKSDFDNFKQTERKVLDSLALIFPLDSNIVFVKYVYKESGSVSIRQEKYE